MRKPEINTEFWYEENPMIWKARWENVAMTSGWILAGNAAYHVFHPAGSEIAFAMNGIGLLFVGIIIASYYRYKKEIARK